MSLIRHLSLSVVSLVLDDFRRLALVKVTLRGQHRLAVCAGDKIAPHGPMTKAGLVIVLTF